MNLDESANSRSTKWEYSWLKTGENWRTLKNKFSNSVNIISVKSNSDGHSQDYGTQPQLNTIYQLSKELKGVYSNKTRNTNSKNYYDSR